MSSTLRALLSGLVDYAGLFPPAALPMPEAVGHYAVYRRGPYSWMLGRFILPVRRLEDYEAAAAPHWRGGAGTPWRLSAIVADDAERELAAVEAFNDRHREEVSRHGVSESESANRPTPRLEAVARIDGVELKAETADEVRRKAAWLPEGVRAWFEVAPGPKMEDALAAVAGLRQGAKLRTGSTEAERIPSSEAVARFILGCVHAGVPFKATAGLHHPLRGRHRLTYEPQSASAVMHGFVNVFLAAALARESVSLQVADTEILATLVALLDEPDPRAFEWKGDQVSWRSLRIEANTLADARQTFAHGFGSCSFDEPLEDLRALGWL